MTEQHPAAGENRVQFDFEIEFSNGGGIQGQGFRLDIDSLNIDDTSSGERPAHTALLASGVRGMGTFPVRAYATVPDSVR